VIEVELETLVNLAALAGFALALFGYLHTMKRDLRNEFKGDIGACRIELKDQISGLRTELKDQISGLRTELKDEISGLRTELKGDIAELRREMKGEFAKVDNRLTTLEQRTYDLSTRLPTSPA
jgi:hypothetical protein